MRRCLKCLMPDTRPHTEFKDGVCVACINYAKDTDWDARKKELEALCDKYRDKDYDCAIAVSGGKDSHFQVYVMKELGMHPILLAVTANMTETGRKNLNNLSEVFGCDVISLSPDISKLKERMRDDFIESGFPNRYIDSLIYEFPPKMTKQLGLKLLVYGEDVNYTYGGKYDKETSSARLQPFNDVVRDWDGELVEDIEPIYLSYFVKWDSHHNYEVARRYGFRHLDYMMENALENYNQIDSLAYRLPYYIKYIRLGYSTACEMASRWIRAGLKTREEMIPCVEKYDGVLDQDVVEAFREFTGMSVGDFYKTLDKWCNRDLFEQDSDGVWHTKLALMVAQ